MVNTLAAKLVHSDGVLQGLHARLQTEGNLGVTHRVSASNEDVMEEHGKKNENKNKTKEIKKKKKWRFVSDAVHTMEDFRVET